MIRKNSPKKNSANIELTKMIENVVGKTNKISEQEIEPKSNANIGFS
jgi:hypothetical protein